MSSREAPPPEGPGLAGATLPSHVGSYAVLHQIARGGMAEIFLARATGLEGFEKLVVVKKMLPELAANSEMVKMFLDEARIAGMLHHPNVVQIYDVGQMAGQYFFAMEFLHGADVSRILKAVRNREQELPLEHALNIAIGVCAGLHYAHEKLSLDGKPLNIIHRDISPQNVFVTFDGGVKVVDFGIAKASHRASATRVGTFKGKVRYMSPEQCSGQALDRRSDIFTVAILLWEMTTGMRLWRGPSDFEVMKAVVEQDAPRPSTVKPGYPPELEEMVMKGLRRDVQGRYPTAEALQLDLEAFARERKAVISSVALSQYMRDLFREEIDAWLVAQKEGRALGDHLAQKLDEQAPHTPTSGGIGLPIAVGQGAERALKRESPAPSGGSLPRPTTATVSGRGVHRPQRRRRGVGALALGTCLAAGALAALAFQIMSRPKATDAPQQLTSPAAFARDAAAEPAAADGGAPDAVDAMVDDGTTPLAPLSSLPPTVAPGLPVQSGTDAGRPPRLRRPKPTSIREGDKPRPSGKGRHATPEELDPDRPLP
ncbi:MAG: serine/threonine protein kinase [Deltaproteobacteria bacterium]|nr:serine/threonine protein kinase [Deltaproteobacteria bacterium]